MTIEEFIEARIAEDERAARAAIERDETQWHVIGRPGAKGVEAGGKLEEIWDDGHPEWSGGYAVVHCEGSPSDDQAEHIARHDPRRTLDECKAWRHAISLISLAHYDRRGQLDETGYGIDLQPIAAIWSDHPDYQQEWAV